LKVVRGTAFDVFGHTEERQTERQLIADYRARITELLTGLNSRNHALAVEVARVPEKILGFGHVKARNVHAARLQWDALMARWNESANHFQ
jgi:indolepyruvate ferredoxin oxidoreductase